MKIMLKTMKLRINAPLRGHKIDSILTLAVDRSGRPIDNYWSDRIKDSLKDGCVEVIVPKTVKKVDKK